MKARLYGSTYALTGTPWPEIWDEVHRSSTRCSTSSGSSPRRSCLPDGGEDLGTRLHHAELASPTRPHPWIPHQGVAGHLARAVARRVDRFWDTAEGRMVPEPVRHHDRAHQGKLTQYLLADPTSTRTREDASPRVSRPPRP